MARYPNPQPGAPLCGFSADATAHERIARWKNPAGGRIRALHIQDWGDNSYLIAGKTPDGALLTEWVGDNNRGDEMHPIKRMVENIFEELDAYQTTVLRSNRIHANHAFGIDIDDGGSNYDIYNNLYIGVGIKTREGFDRRVHNNLLIGAGDVIRQVNGNRIEDIDSLKRAFDALPVGVPVVIEIFRSQHPQTLTFIKSTPMSMELADE